MFRSETYRCLKRALVNLAIEDDLAPQHADPAVKADRLALFAKRLAEQLWIEGYELDPVGRTESMELLARGELPYDYD